MTCLNTPSRKIWHDSFVLFLLCGPPFFAEKFNSLPARHLSPVQVYMSPSFASLQEKNIPLIREWSAGIAIKGKGLRKNGQLIKTLIFGAKKPLKDVEYCSDAQSQWNVCFNSVGCTARFLELGNA